MLPTFNEDNGQDFMNNYYCVRHTWTERHNERNVEKPLFTIGLISFCADQFSSCALS